MTQKIEQAYEELRAIIDGGSESFTHADAVQYLKDVLAKQEQGEPVAWMEPDWADGTIFRDSEVNKTTDFFHDHMIPLYTTPQQRTAAEGEDTRRAWVGLTDEELRQIWYDAAPVEGGTYVDKLRQVEAKLKEKNT